MVEYYIICLLEQTSKLIQVTVALYGYSVATLLFGEVAQKFVSLRRERGSGRCAIRSSLAADI